MDVDQLVVVAISEFLIRVVDEGEATGHAGAEVVAGFTQHDDAAAGHVFAAMVARAFDDGQRAGVAHPETLTRHAGGEQLSAGGAVQTGVADDDGLARPVSGVLGRVDGHPAAGHAFADIVVGIAFQL